MRSGSFVGSIDEPGTRQAPPLDAAESRKVACALAGHLASAQHKGCMRVEVTEPPASAEPPL